MQKPLVAALISLVLLAVAWMPALAAEQAPSPGRITGGKSIVHPDWFKDSFLDIQDDVAEAAGAGRHVILFIELMNCPYCARMAEESFANGPHTEFIRRHFDVIALDMKGDREVALNEDTTATEKEVARMLGVRYTPTVVFLNDRNETVAKVNGYRNAEDFKVVLDYVAEKAYERQTLADYADARKPRGAYRFREHALLKDVKDLSAVADRPLAVLFEDSACVACDALHDGHLRNPEILRTLEGLIFVRVDALSDEPIVDVEGNETTPKAYAAKLGLTYRPGIVLFDKGREIVRIESMLYSYHFNGVLEYVAGRHYEQYPASPFRYLEVKTARLLAEGKDVPMSDPDQAPPATPAQ